MITAAKGIICECISIFALPTGKLEAEGVTHLNCLGGFGNSLDFLVSFGTSSSFLRSLFIFL